MRLMFSELLAILVHICITSEGTKPQKTLATSLQILPQQVEKKVYPFKNSWYNGCPASVARFQNCLNVDHNFHWSGHFFFLKEKHTNEVEEDEPLQKLQNAPSRMETNHWIAFSVKNAVAKPLNHKSSSGPIKGSPENKRKGGPYGQWVLVQSGRKNGDKTQTRWRLRRIYKTISNVFVINYFKPALYCLAEIYEKSRLALLNVHHKLETLEEFIVLYNY